MVDKYLLILWFIVCFILTGCITKQHISTPTAQRINIPQIKDYISTGEYNAYSPFTLGSEGNFYIAGDTIDSRMNIKKYNSQGKYITGWIPEIKKRKKNCWFSEKKHPISEHLTSILADKENIYIAYSAAYNINFKEGNFPSDCTSHIEQFDLNGKFIAAIKPAYDSFHTYFIRYITKDKNGNFYLASDIHVEKYNGNWKLQSILDPFAPEKSNFQHGELIGDVAADSQGYIYILLTFPGYYENGYVAKFDSSGKLINKWNSEDKDKLIFCGLEIDADDNIYLLGIDRKDTYDIHKFDSNGIFITEWNTGCTGELSFYPYNDMRIDSKGNIYVASMNGIIKKFSPKQ